MLYAHLFYISFIIILLYRLDHRLYIYTYYKNSLEFYISYMPDVFTEFT